jgi:hypothetical protein
MLVLDPDARLRKGYFWPQEPVQPGPQEEAQPGAEALHQGRQEFRVLLTLPPFPQAAARLALFLQDVQVLLREDLHDLQEPLLACQALAQTDAQRATLEVITCEVARLDDVLYQIMEGLKGQWQTATHLMTCQQGIAAISDDWSPVAEKEVAVSG